MTFSENPRISQTTKTRIFFWKVFSTENSSAELGDWHVVVYQIKLALRIHCLPDRKLSKERHSMITECYVDSVPFIFTIKYPIFIVVRSTLP